MDGRTYNAQRFSPLDQINEHNVSELGLAWYYDMDTLRGVEATPLYSEGVIYNTSAWNITTAHDARTGKALWTFDPKVPREWGRYACCEPVARGLALWLHNVIIAIAIPLIPTVSRVIRANTLALREQPFVEAAKSIGMSETRIAIRHVLPNTLAPLIVLATAQLGSTILTEASLSFLGLGIPEPYPSWGRMLSESAAEYVRTAPWLVIFPGVAISFVVFGTNLLGDALRDLLDPRQRS